MYVTNSRRRGGIGYALVAELLAKAKRDPSLEQILLAVTVGNGDASKLYRRFGFETYGVEPKALKVGSEYVDIDHMILKL
jgi:ribosomal protein S18 acetylase RimI-like enzyme